MRWIDTMDRELEMLEEFKKMWVSDEVTFVLPEGTTPKQEWAEISDLDIQVIKHKFHPTRAIHVSQEWELLVHGFFRFGAVWNKHGYYFEQLAFDKETE